MVGWLDGWMVGRLDGWMVGWLDGWMVGYLFFFHTSVPTRPYTRASRGKTSLRSEIGGSFKATVKYHYVNRCFTYIIEMDLP